MEEKEKTKQSNLKSKVRLTIFLIIVLVIAQLAIAIISNGNITSLEGYLYSLATTSTSSNASSSNASSSNATNATSSTNTTTTVVTKSSDATLKTLGVTPSEYDFTGFKKTTYEYSVTVPYSVTKLSVYATTNDSAASYEVSGNSGFTVGSNTIKVVVTAEDGNTKTYKINVTREEELETVEYKNGDINSSVIDELKENSSLKEILIDASSDSTVISDLFELIENTSKKLIITYGNNEIVFDGMDINNPTDFNATIIVKEISLDNDISEILPSNGITVQLSSTSSLPGKATVRVKNTTSVGEQLNSREVYIYKFDETEKKFDEISETAIYSSDGYYEFEAEDTDKKVLLDDEIEDETLLVGYVEPQENSKEESDDEDDDEVVSFLESYGTYIAIGAVCLLIILVVIVILIINKSKKNKENKAKKNSEENIFQENELTGNSEEEKNMNEEDKKEE